MQIQINLASISGAKDRYAEMFQVFKPLCVDDTDHWGLNNVLDMEVKKSLNKLRRSDRITWYLRISKFSVLSWLVNIHFKIDQQTAEADSGRFSRYPEFWRAAKALEPKVVKAYAQMKHDTPWLREAETQIVSGARSTRGEVHGALRYASVVFDQLAHSLSLGADEIEAVMFDKQSPNELLNALADLEEQWKENSGEAVEEYGKKLLRFPDGAAWFDLERPYCKTEGDAMGHCGNSAAYANDDTVLSYRVPGRHRGTWVPHLTFILHSNGFLGEMKGRGNDKPSAKYHKVIVALLKSPIIKGISGGGYAPENNFSLKDLDKATRESLLSQKPELESFPDMPEERAVALLIKHDKEVEMVGKAPRLLIASIDESDLGGMFDLDVFQNILKYTSGDEFLEPPSYQSEQGIEVLDELSTEQRSALVNLLMETHRDAIESVTGKELDDPEQLEEARDELDDTDVIHQVLDDDGGELMSSLTNAVYGGWEYGTSNEMFQALQKFAADNCMKMVDGKYNLYAGVSDVQELVNDHGQVEEFNDWLVSTKLLLDVIDVDADALKEQLDISDASEPYYGFAEFDVKAALERFLEEVDLTETDKNP